MSFKYLFACALIITCAALPNFVSASTLTRANISAILAEMNRERLSRGISALGINSSLTRAAEDRSMFLADTGRIFHVTSPAGTPWPNLIQAGYSYTLAGENLALGIENTEALQDRWMSSPTHRDNILSPNYQDVGIGVTAGLYQGRPTSYVVVYFGKKGGEGLVAGARTQSSATLGSPATVSSPVEVAPAPLEERAKLLTQLISLMESYLKILVSA